MSPRAPVLQFPLTAGGVCVYACVRACAALVENLQQQMCIVYRNLAWLHTYTHTYIHTHMHTCTHARVQRAAYRQMQLVYVQ
jgi:hypothetical protein